MRYSTYTQSSQSKLKKRLGATSCLCLTYRFAKYIAGWQTIKSGTVCVAVTKDEGVVLKKVFNYLEDKNVLVLKSTNKRYAPYPVMGQDIQELWKFLGYFEAEFPLN